MRLVTIFVALLFAACESSKPAPAHDAGMIQIADAALLVADAALAPMPDAASAPDAAPAPATEAAR